MTIREYVTFSSSPILHCKMYNKHTPKADRHDRIRQYPGVSRFCELIWGLCKPLGQNTHILITTTHICAHINIEEWLLKNAVGEKVKPAAIIRKILSTPATIRLQKSLLNKWKAFPQA